jgi:hypothetical protein
MSVIFTIIVITTMLSCAATVVIGAGRAMAGDGSMTLILQGLMMNLSVCLLSCGTVPLAAALAMTSKSVIPPMVLGTFASLVTLLLEIGHGMKAILFPWTTPYILVREFGEGFAETRANPYTGQALIALLVVFSVSLVYCLSYYSKAEIHS